MKKAIVLFLFTLLCPVIVFCQGQNNTNNPVVHEGNNSYLVEFLCKKIKLKVYDIEYKEFDFGNTKLTSLIIPGKRDNKNMKKKLNRLIPGESGLHIMYEWEKIDDNMYTMIILINGSSLVNITHMENTIHGNLLIVQTLLEYDKL